MNAGRFSVDGLVDRACGNCGYPVGEMKIPEPRLPSWSIIHIVADRNVSVAWFEPGRMCDGSGN